MAEDWCFYFDAQWIPPKLYSPSIIFCTPWDVWWLFTELYMNLFNCTFIKMCFYDTNEYVCFSTICKVTLSYHVKIYLLLVLSVITKYDNFFTFRCWLWASNPEHLYKLHQAIVASLMKKGWSLENDLHT